MSDGKKSGNQLHCSNCKSAIVLTEIPKPGDVLVCGHCGLRIAVEEEWAKKAHDALAAVLAPLSKFRK